MDARSAAASELFKLTVNRRVRCEVRANKSEAEFKFEFKFKL